MRCNGRSRSFLPDLFVSHRRFPSLFVISVLHLTHPISRISQLAFTQNKDAYRGRFWGRCLCPSILEGDLGSFELIGIGYLRDSWYWSAAKSWYEGFYDWLWMMCWCGQGLVQAIFPNWRLRVTGLFLYLLSLFGSLGEFWWWVSLFVPLLGGTYPRSKVWYGSQVV